MRHKITITESQLKEIVESVASVMLENRKKSGLDKFQEKHGIVPQKIDSNHNVCSIGFSEKEQKWYGWSHRAIYGFGVGSKVKKGDCGYEARGSWTAKTLDDAKQMAIDFANAVS